MFKPESCIKCKLLAKNSKNNYYCRIGAFYDKKTILRHNTHSNCTLKKEAIKEIKYYELSNDEAVEILYNVFVSANIKKRKVTA